MVHAIDRKPTRNNLKKKSRPNTIVSTAFSKVSESFFSLIFHQLRIQDIFLVRIYLQQINA